MSLKILTLIWSIGTGGTERAAVNYAIGYKLFGNDSRVLVLGEGHERYPDLFENSVHTTLVTKSSFKEQDIFNEFKAWCPEIIHVHNYTDSISTYIDLIKGPDTKIVETNVFSRPNFNPGYRTVNLSMQLSAWGYWKYTSCMKGASYCPEVAIVPYIVDDSKFKMPGKNEINSFLSSHNIPSQTYVIGRLGQAHPSKWDVRMLTVIKETIHPDNNIYYLLVGVPNNLAALFNQQSDFFKSRVIQIDKIEGDKNLSIYYYSLNCFAHISKIGESFGYVLAEALVCKVPVITMLTPLKDNAQFEVVGDQYGGLCVTSTSEFIKAVYQLYNNKQLELSIKKNLTNWVQERFSYDMVIPRQIDLYNTLLKGEKLQRQDIRVIIKNNIKHYKGGSWFIFCLAKCFNNPLIYKLVTGLKKRFKLS